MGAEKIHLRPLAIADKDAMRQALGHAEVAKPLMHIPHPLTEEALEVYFERAMSEATPFAISQDDDLLIGLTAFAEMSPTRASIGYWLTPSAWGKGFASQACAEIIEKARAAGFQFLEAHAHQDNPASAHILQKSGFKKFADGLQRTAFSGRDVPIWKFELAL